MTLVSIQKGVIPVPRHWDPENLIVYYTTFSIKNWIPVSSTGMTSQGHWNFCFNICTLAMHLNRYCKLAILH
ncbi:WPE palindromic element domain-containing protein [Wolbachia endosymbiont (group A) of Cheilosia soror]|uniref:WPE palindromic element domain-containing protein n=1 Tax=Wolbachia endosymbiont (group A) of Cheilosia soror TaxID=2953995 RepID=UPI0021F81D44|nr:WPE palindromic element domain-containing protein [Wolbachia endosymbiont (group A) of Cheilosia soror]